MGGRRAGRGWGRGEAFPNIDDLGQSRCLHFSVLPAGGSKRPPTSLAEAHPWALQNRMSARREGRGLPARASFPLGPCVTGPAPQRGTGKTHLEKCVLPQPAQPLWSWSLALPRLLYPSVFRGHALSSLNGDDFNNN